MIFSRPASWSPFLRAALVALGCAAASSVGSAQTVTVLDDYSTDLLNTNYVQKNVPGFGAGGWVVAGGELQPETAAAPVNGYGAWAWTANSLQNVGDWFSIDLTVSGTGSDHNGGLSVWTGNTATFDRVLEPRLSYNSGYDFVGSDQQSSEVWNEVLSGGLGSGVVTLKITLDGVSGGDSTLRIDLSDSNGAIGPAEFYTVSGYTGSFYVGPSAWQATGGNITFDNLTYSTTSAVPEPASCAAMIGAAALGLAWMRRSGRRRREGASAQQSLR